MSSIIYPMKVHAVKLEYRRQKLEKMVQGCIKTVDGEKIVYITHDPEYPNCDSRHPRRLKINSKRGRQYVTVISNYLKLEKEYNELLNSWYAIYNVAPPRVNFPIIQKYDPHHMNNKFFESEPDRLGKYKSDNPTVTEHGELKSKNEQIGADILKQLDIPFKYETALYLESIDDTINPDFLVNFYEIDRCAYLEILGMNDKAQYSLSTATKINGFSRQMYRPGREVIYVHLYDKYNFDEAYFISQVLSAFNDLIPDNALIWDSKSQVV